MIISLFSSLYGNREIGLTDDSWRSVLDLVMKADLAPQLYHIIQRHQRAEEVPQFVIRKLRANAHFTTLQNTWIKAETRRIISSLSVRQVPVILLKGTGFAERFFGHIGARGTGDIDILVPEDLFQKAESCLIESGFQLADHYLPFNYHVIYSKHLPNIGVITVELHKSLMLRYRSKIDIGRLLAESASVNVGSTEKQFTLQQTLYVICLHSSKHSMIRYKHVLDIAHLIFEYGEQLDYGELFNRAKQDGTYGMVTGSLFAIYRLFPELHRIKPLPKRIRRFPWYSENLIMDVELMRKGIRYYFHIYIYQLFISDGARAFLQYLRYTLFPPRVQLERRLDAKQCSSLGILYFKLYAERFNIWRSHRNMRTTKTNKNRTKDT